MLQPKEAEVQERVEFKWGKKKGVARTNKDVHFYESFTYCGVEYSLYDSAYFYRTGDAETFIGKLIQIYETPTHDKKVKVVWFFRPFELRNFLGDYEPCWNEIFLASGDGRGLCNINSLEAIVQKCNVLCVSKDPRNPQPSKEEVRMANYVFSHTFDVGKRKISKNFVDKIAGIKVEHFFNSRRDQKSLSSPDPTPSNSDCSGKSFTSHLGLSKAANNDVTDRKISSRENSIKKEQKGLAIRAVEKRCLVGADTTLRPKTSDKVNGHRTLHCRIEHNDKVGSSKGLLRLSVSTLPPPKKRKLLVHERAMVEYDDVVPQPAEESRTGTDVVCLEGARKPDIEKRNWFIKLPFEERLKTDEELDSMILLENLDPSFTSSDVEDLVWQALHQEADAKMIQLSTFSSPHYGKALVLFKSKDAAELAISRLNKGCLMLADGRIIVGSKESIRQPGSQGSFVGHLALDKVRFQREAVSTSHCSQPNNYEFEMAVQWRALQAKSDEWWKKLHERQAKEINLFKSQLKTNPKQELPFVNFSLLGETGE